MQTFPRNVNEDEGAIIKSIMKFIQISHISIVRHRRTARSQK